MKLREHLEAASNDYTALEERYRDATGAELVVDPFGSYGVVVPLTKSMSVLIGAHDSREALRRALRSLEQCTMNLHHPDLLEVVVVDDGSGDGTWEMLEALDVDLRLTCIRQARAGLNHAHNTALAVATGDVVVFSDADVLHMPFALEELAKRHEILDGVTLAGFRFDVSDGAEPDGLTPAFWSDFRLSFPGVPDSPCRETDHLKELGHGRALLLANGARYNLPAFVVGALFSIERRVLLAAGGSETTLSGWGCEDSLIGARSIALGNHVVPVYGAAGAHVAHPPRHNGAEANFARARALLEQEFEPAASPPPPRAAIARLSREPTGRAERVEHRPPAPCAAALTAVGRFAEAADRAETPLERARAFRLLGRYDEALAEVDDDWEAALVHAATGRWGEARSSLERARDAGSYDAAWALEQGAEGHKLRGNAHARQGLHDIAIRDYELSLALEPDRPWTHFDRGESLTAVGRLAEAEAELQLADLDDRNRTWVHSALADVHAAAGRHGRAKLELERALRLYPGNARAAAAAAALADDAEAAAGIVRTPPLLRSLTDVPGWLGDDEVDLLRAVVVRAAADGAALVELGSFLGRSTIAIARTLQLLGASAPFTAIDPHSAYAIGGIDDTYDAFCANLRAHGVADRVRVVRARSQDVEWDAPLALLFVDALHDYESVRRDHERFGPFVVRGGFVAFHDYAADCPGVVQFVDEQLERGELELAAHRDRLIVLQRR